MDAVVKMFARYSEGDSVRTAPWHIATTGEATGDGRTILVSDEDYEKWEADGTLVEKLQAFSGHDFEVVERPLLISDSTGLSIVEGASVVSGFGTMVNGYKALVREDTNEVFNIVGKDYTVFQNSELWELTEAILEAGASWETGGTLKDGKVVWILATVDEPFTIKGDDSETLPYIVATASHDGTVGITVRNTNIRVVCWNTLDASANEAAQTGREFSFRHTKNLGNRIETARQVLAGSKDTSLAFRELANELVEVPFGELAQTRFLESFLPEPVGVITDRVKENIATDRAKVRAIWNSKSIPEAHKNTGYGALQAGIEYLDHLRGFRNNATYLGRTLIKPEPLKNKLIPLIRECSEYEADVKKIVVPV